MITEKQRDELEQFKPRNYKDKVRENLKSKGFVYTNRTITAVYLGEREILEIEEAIVDVFLEYKKSKTNSKKRIDKRLGIA